MKIVQVRCSITELCFVECMKLLMLHDVELKIIKIRRLLVHKHDIKKSRCCHVMTHGRKHLKGFHQALNQSTELPLMTEAGSSVTAASTTTISFS